VINPKPAAQIKPASLTFCPDESVSLIAQDMVGNRYRWIRDGVALSDTVSQVVAKQGGTYQVTVTGATGCTALSPGVLLTQAARPVIQLDSIAPICLSAGVSVSLTGQPTGGIYTGPGVLGTQFSPERAGVGKHQLTYTVVSNNGCRAEKKQWVEVWDSPRLTGSTTYFLVKGKSVQLVTQASGPISQYQWEPPASLNQADIASPLASPESTTPYSLTATNAAGCTATLAVLVEVTELLFIPSAFSPNSDGLNDSWIIPNIRLFPNNKVTIYNRWGELVFSSQGYATPWDGTYRQERVPPGLYTYQIRTGDGPLDTVYRGQLMVVH
jgi:gliding motility-associated-like protein